MSEYDTALKPSVEEMLLQDPNLRAVWGERLYRILLRAENPQQRSACTTRISRLP